MQQRKTYFAIALSILLVLGFIATSAISYFVAHDSLSDQITGESLPLTSDNIYSEIERDLLRSILISSLMANDTFVRDWTIGGEVDPQAIQRYLSEIQQEYDTTTAFFVSETTRHYYHPRGILKTVTEDDPDDAWYFRVREMRDDYEINVDTDTADPSRLNIFINYRVRGFDGNYLGATGIGLAVDSVAELIATYERRYGRTIYLVDREGDVTLRGRDLDGPDNIRDRPGIDDVATQVLSNPAVDTRARGEDGETLYINSRLIPELDWHLVVTQEGLTGENRILNTLMLNIGVALLLSALVAAGGWYTVRGYHVQLESMATTDELTGCANRQLFESLFDHVSRNAQRRNQPMSLISFDADQFKPINDRYGHATGDIVLRTLTNRARHRVRDGDTLFRWGGDEFLILLPDCNIRDAARIAEDIRAAVAAEPMVWGDERIPLAISVGVAEWRPRESSQALIGRCDQALYEAKRRGGNQVATA